MSFVLWNGESGDTWVNTTDKVAYQFVASLHNTCGACLQYHMAIGRSWPIPIHFGCACRQLAIYPGQESAPFVDFRELLDELGDHQKAEAVGASNWKLIDKGVVKWEDVVTQTRVRDFREVVSLKKLDVKTLTDAGVSKRVADDAYKSVNTAAHTLAEESRKRLFEALQAKRGQTADARKAVAERLASRVTIGAGPSGPQQPPKPPPPTTPPPAPATMPKPPPKTPTIPKLSDAEKAARLRGRFDAINYDKAVAKAEADIEKARRKQRKQSGAGEKDNPDRIKDGAIGDRIRQYEVGDAKIKAIKDLTAERSKLRKQVVKERERLYGRIDREVKIQGRLAKRFGDSGGKLPEAVRERIDARKRRADQIADVIDRSGSTILRIDREQAAAVAKILRVDDPVRAVMEDVTAGHRTPGGIELRPLDAAARARADEAAKWLSAVVRRGDSAEMRFKIGQAAGVRASYHDSEGVIKIAPDESVRVIVHEFAHGLEYRTLSNGDSIQKRSREFLEYRAGGEDLVNLRQKFGNFYDVWEAGRKDRFDEAFGEESAYYVGKHYGDGATEILSMGFERFYQDAASFAQKDPEFVKFLLGIADGSLR